MQQMLSSIRSIAGNAYVFRQDNAPVHRARQTVETPKFIAPDLWPPNIPVLNAVDRRIWGVLQDRVYQTPVRDVTDLKQRFTDTVTHETDCCRVSFMILSTNGGSDFGPVWRKKEDISNICCNNWTWTRSVVQLNLLCFRRCNNRHILASLCTWLIPQGSVATVSRWGG